MDSEGTKIYVFDELLSREIAKLSLMPDIITNNYMPAILGAWGVDLAESLVSPGGAGEAISAQVLLDSNTLRLSDLTLSEMLTYDKAVDDKYNRIMTPALFGNLYELAEAKEWGRLPENIVELISQHERKMLWIQKSEWEKLFAGTAHRTRICHAPKRIDAMFANVEHVIYVARIMRKRDLPLKKTNSDDRRRKSNAGR